MKGAQNPGRSETWLSSGLRASGYAVSISLLAGLILAWLLTAPLFRCGVYLSELYRKRFAGEMKGTSQPHRFSEKQDQVLIRRQRKRSVSF